MRKEFMSFTVSLEMAKELKEKGYPQENSNFYWVENSGEDENRNIVSTLVFAGNIVSKIPNTIAAPTSIELLEKLPKGVEIKNKTWVRFSYKDRFNGIPVVVGYGNEYSLEDSLAKLYVELKTRS